MDLAEPFITFQKCAVSASTSKAASEPADHLQCPFHMLPSSIMHCCCWLCAVVLWMTLKIGLGHETSLFVINKCFRQWLHTWTSNRETRQLYNDSYWFDWGGFRIFWFQGDFEDTRILPGFGTRKSWHCKRKSCPRSPRMMPRFCPKNQTPCSWKRHPFVDLS